MYFFKVHKKTQNLNLNLKEIEMEQEKSLQFMQIAMKYLPEAKEAFEQSGIELSMDLVQPFMSLFTKVMNEAYELGVEDAKKELNRE